MSKNIVPVFMAVDDGYIPFLGVALKSVIENSSKENKYEIKILYTKVSEENKNKIKLYFFKFSIAFFIKMYYNIIRLIHFMYSE